MPIAGVFVCFVAINLVAKRCEVSSQDDATSQESSHSQQICYRLWINHMLLRLHTRCQAGGAVVWQDRHGRLGEDGADVQLGGDAVHGGSGKAAAGVDRTLMGVHAGEGG